MMAIVNWLREFPARRRMLKRIRRAQREGRAVFIVSDIRIK